MNKEKIDQFVDLYNEISEHATEVFFEWFQTQKKQYFGYNKADDPTFHYNKITLNHGYVVKSINVRGNEIVFTDSNDTDLDDYSDEVEMPFKVLTDPGILDRLKKNKQQEIEEWQAREAKKLKEAEEKRSAKLKMLEDKEYMQYLKLKAKFDE